VLRRRLLPPWLRRGVEAGVLGALLSLGTLVAFYASRPEPRLVLPTGLDSSFILLPAVVALGIFAVAYPTFLAATREDAIMGVVAAFLVAADALMLISFVIGDAVMIHPIGRSLPLGVLASAVALPAAVVGVLAGQLSVPLGFGRSSGVRSAVAGGIAGLVLVVVAAYAV
jgi:hypothetical protein